MKEMDNMGKCIHGMYIYTENLSTDAEKEEKIDKIEKHVKNRLRNDHFVIDCDECWLAYYFF